MHSGVFLQVTGPQFETPVEIEMYRQLGADTVGMSTAVETIAARHMGMKVCGINCVSNMAAGMEEEGGEDHCGAVAPRPPASQFDNSVLKFKF